MGFEDTGVFVLMEEIGEGGVNQVVFRKRTAVVVVLEDLMWLWKIESVFQRGCGGQGLGYGSLQEYGFWDESNGELLMVYGQQTVAM